MDMESQVLKAAYTGDIQLLRYLLGQDPLILKRVVAARGDTLLHIACLAGHASFVGELLCHAPEFAAQTNHDGSSPLHIAAAEGNVEILQQLLQLRVMVDAAELCPLVRIRGRERRIPLHYAVIKGRVGAVRELLSADNESIEIVTSRGETALHLAVNYYKFDVLSVLVKHVVESFDADKGRIIFNKKDERGNTIFHLAACKKQHEVINLLLEVGRSQTSSNFDEQMIEVNSQNEMGHTPLDLLLLLPSEAGDVEIQDLIRQAGGSFARDLSRASNQQNGADEEHEMSSNNHNPNQHVLIPLRRLFKYNSHRDTPKEVRNVLLLIATLITTATFQAILNSPGTNNMEQTPDQQDYMPVHLAGESGSKIFSSYIGYYLTETVKAYVSLFALLFNTMGFLTSVHMINVLIQGFPLKLELRVSMAALVMAYMGFLAVNSFPALSMTLIILVAVPIVIVVIIRVRTYRLQRRDPWRDTIRA